MANLQAEAASASAAPRRWPFFLAGILLFLLGPILYAVQLHWQYLWIPWYLPVLSSLGVLLMAVAVWRRGGILWSAGLVLFVLVCGFEWWFFLVKTSTPVYTGPAQPGQQIPAFATTLADGKAFTNADLKNGSSAVLVFFRGRW